MRITATFLDEISSDIPHQNWGVKEWDRDFAAMKKMGIDTVVLIRSGFGKFIAYPSPYLVEKQGCFRPPVDLVRMFLELSEKYGMDFYFGLYDSRFYRCKGDLQTEEEINKFVSEEFIRDYGKSPAFKGWYLSIEVGRACKGIMEHYRDLGSFVKSLAPLPVMISPFIEAGQKLAQGARLGGDPAAITLAEHEKEWDDILAGIEGSVDIIAFQDGNCPLENLPDFLTLNKSLTDRHHMHCWTNSETFDRDMPIRFLPIKWEKLLLKLQAAKAAGVEKGLTFEFSHFMSPNSCYQAAHGLYDRYCEYFGIQ